MVAASSRAIMQKESRGRPSSGLPAASGRCTARQRQAAEATMRPVTFGAVAPGLYAAVVRQAGTGTHQKLKHSGRVE